MPSRVTSWAHPLPAAGFWGRHVGSVAHILWVRVSRLGDPHCPFGLHALLESCVPQQWRKAAWGGLLSKL